MNNKGGEKTLGCLFEVSEITEKTVFNKLTTQKIIRDSLFM